MKIPKEELFTILSQFNPWWRGEKIPDLPTWCRAIFRELLLWIENPPATRAVLLSGPRQVGKTTLLLQAIQKLIESGVPPANILYATFDHPVLKLAGLDTVLEAWRELEPKAEGPEYLFLDEAQFIKDIGTWVKHEIDFIKTRRIVFTGSATPLLQADQESGVGRWHSLRMSTLSFYEYLQIRKTNFSSLPQISSAPELFEYTSYCSSRQVRFSYWRSHKEKEVDLIVEMEGTLIPFEVKYRSQFVQERDVIGLSELCQAKTSIRQAYVLTKAPQDIGKMKTTLTDTRCTRIPAALFCYWLGSAEFAQKNILLRSS